MDVRLASEILVQNKQRENLPSVIETKLTLLRKYFTSRYYPLHQALSLHFKIHPKRVYLPAYEVGAEANPAHFAPVITREITMLEIKELRLNDAAFVLSNMKWTYAKLVEKNKQDGTFTFKFQMGQDLIAEIQATSDGEWNLLSRTIRMIKQY